MNSKILFLSLVFLISCNGYRTDNFHRTIFSGEIAAATLGGSLNATDSAGTQAQNHHFKFNLLEETALADNVACPTLAGGGTGCSVSGTSATLNYTNCSFKNDGSTWNGGMVLTFASATTPSCGSYPIETAGSVIRTFLTNTTRLNSNFVDVSLDSKTLSGYAQPVNGGAQVNYLDAADRTLIIKGLHIQGTLPKEPIWDFTASSDSIPIGVSGTTQTITSGQITLQDNKNQVTQTVNINNLGFSSGCCFPTSGTLSTTFSNNQSPEIMTFTSTCGSASVASNNQTEALTLTHCF